MKEDIPKVGFFKKSNVEIEFEIFRLSSLFSRLEKLTPPIDKPHSVGFYQIIYITEGRGLHYIDFQPYRFSTNSIFFVSKGQVHAFDISSKKEGFVILFTDEFLSKNMIHSDMLSMYRLYNYHLHDPVIRPEDTGGDMFNTIIDEMYREYLLEDNFAKEETLRLLLKLLLLRAERIKRTQIQSEKNSEWFKKFSNFKVQLENRFTETRNAKDYADIIGISYKHLNEVCRSVTGSTAKTFIDHFIILEAKRLLAVTDNSSKELTYTLGFDEPTNFLKYFKKHTGESPSQFRKKIKK